MTFSDGKRKKLKMFLSLVDKRVRILFSAVCAEICEITELDADIIVTDDPECLIGDGPDALRRGQAAESWIILVDAEASSDLADNKSRTVRLARPVSVATLESLLYGIRDLIDDGNLVSSIELSHGTDGFEPDGAEQSVIYAGKRLKLTEREFALFSVLWENAGQPVSRAQLSKTIWSDKDDNSHLTNVCDVYISYLRKKIRRVFGFEAIVTIRGKGYMLVHK